VRRLAGMPPGPAILMYHRVARPAWDPWELAVSPEHFEAQLGWLKRARTVLPLEEFAALHRRGRLPSAAVALTFDDGYACNAHTAAPIAAACEVPITIFLTTGAISGEGEFWWDDLERIVTAAPDGPLDCRVAGQTFAFEAGADRAEAYRALWAAMRTMDDAERRETLVQIARGWGVGLQGRQDYRAMTAAEVRDLTTSPWVTFGAHSVSHPPLSELTSAEQRAEIETSRDACAALTGYNPRLFAYPFGDYSDQTVELVKEAGFETAVTTDAGFVNKGSTSLRLPRLHAGDWPAERLAALLSTGL